MIKILNRRNFFRISIVLLIVTIGIFFRFERFSNRVLWVDEITLIDPMSESLKSTLNAARRILQFPGDPLLKYPFFKLFGKNKWGLAIPHIFITMLGFYLLYILCRKYFKNTLSFIITFLIVAFNANLIFHAFEIRAYGVLASLGIAVFLVMQYIVENKEINGFRKFMINLFLFTVILFHLYGSFMLLFLYLFHIFLSRKKEGIIDVFLRNLKDYYLSVLFALPVWFYFASADKSYLAGMKSSVFLYIKKDPISLFKGIFCNLIGFKPFYILSVMFPIAFLISHKDRLKQAMFLFIGILAPTSLVLFTCIKYGMWFIQRLFIWEMPLFAFLVGWTWDSVLIFAQNKSISLKEGKVKKTEVAA